MTPKQIAKSKKITHCYIRKGPYYRPGSCGYTDYTVKAGVYTKEEAISHAERCRELTLVPINNAEHNELIMEEVKDLLSRFIPVPKETPKDKK